ncbi:hypothetical protein MO7_03348 [Escherichia coli O104:H4 str. Ec11-9941]|nr:hypothetical protein MO7_03348 [Escherichia coli O104:H4 str. Ec11-9941]
MMTKTQINKLIKMMNNLDYPFEAPLKESFIESIIQIEFNSNSTKEGANKRGNSSRLTQSFHFFMFEPIFSPVNALNQPI